MLKLDNTAKYYKLCGCLEILEMKATKTVSKRNKRELIEETCNLSIKIDELLSKEDISQSYRVSVLDRVKSNYEHYKEMPRVSIRNSLVEIRELLELLAVRYEQADNDLEKFQKIVNRIDLLESKISNGLPSKKGDLLVQETLLLASWLEELNRVESMKNGYEIKYKVMGCYTIYKNRQIEGIRKAIKELRQGLGIVAVNYILRM